MTTQPTTGWTIWNVFRLNSTYQKHGSGTESAARLRGISASKRKTPLGTGTSLKLAGSGIAAKPSAAKAGPNGSASRVIALSVAKRLMRLFGSRGIRRSIAQHLARLRHTALGRCIPNGPPVVASVRELSETADVWDITVPDGRWFALANGAVVHNSDAFGLLAIIYEAPYAPPPPRGRYSSRRSSSAATWESA